MLDSQMAGVGRIMPALDRQILEHSRRWILSGMYLRCTACGIGQTASEGNRPFSHDISCVRFSARDYPWQELACILHWVPDQNAMEVSPVRSKFSDM